MQLVYIDDAKEHGRAYYSGVMIDAARWFNCREGWQAMLADITRRRRFRPSRELHATKLLGGHGHYFEMRPTNLECVETHLDVLRAISAFPTVRLFLSCGPLALEERVFERLITRVDRTMRAEDDHALLICDEGKTYDDLLERLRTHNPIHFREGAANIPLRRLVDDIVYRKSHRSFMVQAADACVYTLFRKEDPLPRLTALGFERAFPILAPIVFRGAAPGDADGIIRC